MFENSLEILDAPMLKRLEQQADKFLEKNGFHTNGDFINPPKQEEREISSDYKFLEEHEIVTNLIHGSFATRQVHQEELSYVIDARFTENYKSAVACTGFEWRLFSLIVPRYLLSGYGVFHYQFVAKEGIYLALYKLNDEECAEYKENHLRVSEQYGIDYYDLLETRRLYGIDGSMEKYVLEPGRCYVIPDRKITKTARNRLKKWFMKYKHELFQ